MSLRLSKRRALVSQSEIRAMTRECRRVGGINLAQGVCDLDVPEPVLRGAEDAMRQGFNIYTPCEGLPELRRAIAGKMRAAAGMEVDPEAEIVVSAGATGAFYATCLALLEPGDEVILLEPFYGYHTATLRAMDCVPVFARMEPPDWAVPWDELERLAGPRTRAIMINTPNNPSGKVFSRAELEELDRFAARHDLIVFTDEIYEHFVFDGREHVVPATVGGLRERTVTIGGFSKVFAITGWRLGYAVCPPEVAACAAHFNDLVYVCAPSPLQLGAAAGLLNLGPDYYQGVSDDHQAKRDQFCAVLAEIGLVPHVPQGAYYVLADMTSLPGDDDKARAMHLLEATGVACVPGRAFYHDDAGAGLARFCFAKKWPELEQAMERLRGLVR